MCCELFKKKLKVKKYLSSYYGLRREKGTIRNVFHGKLHRSKNQWRD